ncbi:diguanylate cyclase (GGDEF)-like protein [Halospina denitrificans]|uniref:diguanylate cyclase n=1 Tax=Halospina denitrificans TaxID=332522 RepID=A0A4R7JXX0_9GAMM|nr:diguanylate cyclase [Halospina denitrificans]TDT43340.1 diguanylate cyclase (GGDEF)-like protein [Halospina denitrificans]
MKERSEQVQHSSRRSSIEAQRRALLHWLLLLTAAFTLGFSLVNLSRGILFVAAIELFVTVFAFALLFVIPRSRNIQVWSFLYLLVLFSMLVVALLTPNLSDKVFVWFYLIPVLALFIHGRTLGLALSLVYLAVAWLLYYYRYYDAPELLDVVGLTNVVACSLVLTGGVYAYEYSREQAEDRLHRMASTDSLTGLANRKHLRELLDYTVEECHRTKAGFSILGMDLDYFKSVNDRYGHDVGDQVLQQVGSVLEQRLRQADVPARWGGEEFMVLLPGTDREGASRVAENVRETLAASPVRVNGEDLSITTSIGIAEFPEDGNTVRELLIAADNCLYEAKCRGRDRVVNDAVS